jgi:mono/diheme cytochrome c family protein
VKKRSVLELVVILVLATAALGILGGVYFVTAGVSARPQPGAVERFVSRTVRDVAIGWHARHDANPVPKTEEAIAAGRAHFADHCASCHANDGSGNTEMGRGLYARAPDMRLAATQDLKDYELFYIIENGIRLTGMPGWTTGTRAGEEDSWRLVHFIRHLPQITPEEIEQMQALNPRSPEEIRQEIEAERFLRGEDPAPATETPQPNHGEGHGHE